MFRKLTAIALFSVGSLGGAHAQLGVVNLVDPYSDTIVVQAGDTFYVTAEHSAKSDKKLVVDLGDGRSGLTADIGETIPVKYDVPGDYTITSKLGNRRLDPVTVEVLANAVPADVPKTIGPRVTMQTTSSSVGVGVGSVYAENGYFPIRIAASGPCFFQLKRYGYGVVWQGNIPAGDTIDVIDGPDDGEPIWTLIKFIDGAQRGGTHVLSPNSPYRLQIANIKLEEGPSYAPVGSYVANMDWLLGTCHEAKLQVVPDPWWAIDPVCGFLYEWSGTDLTPSTGLEKEVDYDDGGVKDVYLICDSDDTGGESTTINSLQIDLDGKEPDANGNLVDVDDDIEDDAGVLAVSQTTRLIVRRLGSGVAVGSYKLTWSNPSENKELKIKREGVAGAGWKTSGHTEVYDNSDHTYRIKLEAPGNDPWLDTDTVMVTLTHEGYNVTCEDRVKLVPVKVDLDVDADYQNGISVDSPDDPIEESAGGLVAAGSREPIILRQVLPASSGQAVSLLYSSVKIEVFDSPSAGYPVLPGTQYSAAVLPDTLWVEGLAGSENVADEVIELVSSGGAEDRVRFTVAEVEIDTPDGEYVGTGKDTRTITLDADISPDLTGVTWLWSKESGDGNGTFTPSNGEDTEFEGSTKGKLTVQVAATVEQSCVPVASKDLVVIEIDDLTEEPLYQFMDMFYEDDGLFSIPYNDTDGDLESVLILPPGDDDDAYDWGTDFDGTVDHDTGAVDLVFTRDGEYVVKIVRESGSTYIQILVGSGDGPLGAVKTHHTQTVEAFDADLILISSSANDNRFLVNARAAIVGEKAISSAGTAAAEINFAYAGSEITVILFEHGAPGVFSIGAGDQPAPGTGTEISEEWDNAEAMADLADAMQGQVSEFVIISCEVAAGDAGASLLQTLADESGTAIKAYDKKVYCRADGTISLDADTSLVVATPDL